MTVSSRIINQKAQRYMTRQRGAEVETKSKSSKLPVGPVMLGFFLFVVVGSALLQIIRTATTPASLPV